MVKHIINTEHEAFSIEFIVDGSWLRGVVYPIYTTTDGELLYVSNKDGSCMEIIDKETRSLFEFLFCWRGVWEGRIYFTDEEYWCEELKTISEIWDKVEPILKEELKTLYPDCLYED